MKTRFLISLLFFLLVLTAPLFAQNVDVQPLVDNKIDKMRIVLNLTDSQVMAIKPIVKNYVVKRTAFLQEVAGEGIVDHVSVKASLKELKENEYQQLGKILGQDQLQKWINKENLMEALNPDNIESADDDDVSLTPSGANFKF